jgi:hypothetical protein
MKLQSPLTTPPGATAALAARGRRSCSALLAATALCGAVTACGGGYPEPRNQLTASEAAVRAAEEVGAQSSPQSALHLKRAREQVDDGKTLIREGENERAEWVMRRAESDADLALSLAREENRRKKAAETKEDLVRLQDQIREAGSK